jgi:HK97 gp10 family phage protein
MATGLEGVADLIGQLNELGTKVAARELRHVVREAMEPALHYARSNAPVGTVPHKTYRGRLVSPGFAVSTLQVVARFNKRTGAAEAMLGYGREAFYAAIFTELGTSKMAARPVLRPALEATQEQALQIIRTRLQEWIEKVRRRQSRK